MLTISRTSKFCAPLLVQRNSQLLNPYRHVPLIINKFSTKGPIAIQHPLVSFNSRFIIPLSEKISELFFSSEPNQNNEQKEQNPENSKEKPEINDPNPEKPEIPNPYPDKDQEGNPVSKEDQNPGKTDPQPEVGSPQNVDPKPEVEIPSPKSDGPILGKGPEKDAPKPEKKNPEKKDRNPRRRNRKDEDDDDDDESETQDEKYSGNTYVTMGTIFSLLSAAVVIGFLTSEPNAFAAQTTWANVRESILNGGQISKLEVHEKKVFVYKHNEAKPSQYFTIPSTKHLEESLNELEQDFGIPQENRIPIAYINEPDIIGPAIVLCLITSFLLTIKKVKVGGSLKETLNFQQGKSFRIKKQIVNTKFEDVAGLDEAKQEVWEFVDFLKNPKKYVELGARIPKGALLSGPPGTGKTLLAKAIAGESKVPFFAVTGSEFVETYVGVGASRVRKLFKEAKACAPSIIFIDEIDTIGKSREGSRGFRNDEREGTLNQLLVEMDGFSSNTSVIVFAGTNLPDSLDSALLRPGRFDRQISIDKPDVKGRYDIFLVHLKKVKTLEKIEDLAKRLATLTPDFSGAEIENVCNEGAIHAARVDKQLADINDFEYAIERVSIGVERKNRTMTEETITTVAYHEAGHAIVGWFMEHTTPVMKVSIVPRGSGILGYVQNQPKDHHIYTKEMLFDRICTTLGGRIAESIFFGNLSTGAQDDLEKVTQMAYSQVADYGMSEKVGNLSFSDFEDKTNKPYSEATANMIDDEARNILRMAYEATRSLLMEKKDLVEKVALRLLEKENLTREDMVELCGERPYPQEKSALEELNEAIEKQGNKKPTEEKKESEEVEEKTFSDEIFPRPAII